MEMQAKLEKRVNEEYETQYFGSSAKGYAKEVSQIFYESVRCGFDGFQKYICLLKAKASEGGVASAEDLQQIEQITQIAVKECESEMEGILHSLEEYMVEKMFHIPEHVVLLEDRVQEASQAGDEAALDQEIAQALQQLKALRYEEASLQQELDEARELLPVVSQLVGQMKGQGQVGPPNDTHSSQIQTLVDAARNLQVEVSAVLPKEGDEEEEEGWGESEVDTNCTPPSADL